MPVNPITGKIIESQFKLDLFELGCHAGFYNGEGNVSFWIKERNKSDGSKKHTPYLILQIGQKDPELLYKFKRFFKTTCRICSYESEDRTHNKFQVTKFEDVQFIVACMWNGLSSEKKKQYKITIGKYLDFKRNGKRNGKN